MPSLVPGDPIWQFCGFANGTSFRTKFFLDESSYTLTPCAEFGLVSLQSIPLLFYTILNFCLVSDVFPRYNRPSVTRIFSFRVIVSVATTITLLASIILSFSSIFQLKEILVIEYGLLAVVWLVFAALWVLSLRFKSWTRTSGITVSAFFASKVFHLIVANRWIKYGFYDPRTFILLFVSVIQLINSVVNIVEWRIHRSSQSHEPLDSHIELEEAADEGAGLISRIFFCWTNQLIKKGGKRQLNTLDDIFNLPPSLQVATIERELVENSPTYFSDGMSYSLARSLLNTFGVSYFSLAFLRIASDSFTFAGPILLHLLVEALEMPTPQADCFLFAGLMILSSFLAAMFSLNFTYYVQKISIRVRAATVTAIYEKLLLVPLSEMSSFSTGQILNFISTDVDRIVNFCNSFHAFWSLPVQMCIALYLLYREIGPAFLSGVVAALILVPINKVITNSIGTMSEKLMHAKDQRIKMTTETVEGIRTVKLSAWEEYFEQKIGELREKELYYLKARKYLDALCVYLWASAPLLITVSILSTYTLVFHEKLTAAKVFTSLALVNILIMPLNAFPWVLNGLVEALVSLKRLEWFFTLKNMDHRELYTLNNDTDCALSVREGNFFWKNASTTVNGVNFSGKKGTIIGVSGDVGSGKSSLLLGFLGETKSLAECIGITQESVVEGIGYMGQERWLSRGSVRDNILAGKAFDENLYQQVLEATCLNRDISLMPGGDSYEISDNGATLSGGQRTRVALARAFYQDNSLYLLDEPFASLDRKVADSIWTKGLEMLRECGKLVVVATHDTRLLARADDVILLDREGRMVKRGPPSEVLDVYATAMTSDSSLTSEEGEMEGLERVLAQDEEKQVGAVRANVYGSYARSTGIFLSFLILVALFMMQSSKNVADWWLSRWTDNQGNISVDRVAVSSLLMGERHTDYLSDSEMDRSVYFLTVYSCIAAGNTIFTLIRAFLFAFGGIVAAKELHSNLLRRLLQTSTSWWDRTPSGRVINRLCSDVYTVDDNLPFQLNIFLASLFNLLGALIISVMGLPLLIPIVFILFLVYYFIQKYYRMTTVELKRLSSLSLSPFYSHLGDTVNGLVTIRAQRFVERFTREMRVCLTANLRAQFSSLAASQWLSVRLSLIAVTVVAAIAVSAIIQHRFTGVDSGLVGLAITYALSVTGLLNGLLGSFIETEKEMVSVERIDEYLQNVPQEEDRGKGKMPRDVNGRVDFSSVSLRYERGLPLALENVSFRAEGGQRMAIVGRTGSGKSSIFQALLRAVPLESGRICVDGVDIETLSLRQLRTMFGIVPQHPFIFSGSLLDNLTINCPTIDRIYVTKMIRVANLESLLARIGGVDGLIEEGGKNLSFGEKQVISICRVLLAKPRIVLVDEATSHLDSRSHRRMTSLLAAHLPLATVISIVHTVDGLSDYDLIMEMDRGKVVRVGPAESEA